MNRLSVKQRAKVVACLIEGCSLRSTVRMTGVAKKTVSRILVEVGEACAEYSKKVMQNLTCKIVQVDEVWSFTYCKQVNVQKNIQCPDGAGDTWTWIALDSETKLIPAWHVGKRDITDAHLFIHDLKNRLANRVQLTSDGHRAYLTAVEDAFGADVDYSMIVKLYGKPGKFGTDNPTEVRYSPPCCIGARKRKIIGNPNRSLISTSHVERQNLTLRMSNRRFTRLTNAFSKKLENHKHACALHFTYYNFCRIHQTLRVTPAMEAGLTDRVLSLEELVALTENSARNLKIAA